MCIGLVPTGFFVPTSLNGGTSWVGEAYVFTSFSWQEEIARLSSLQPQVDLLETRLNELKEEKEGDEDPSAFLDADITAFNEHFNKVLEDLRARERQLQLGEDHLVTLTPKTKHKHGDFHFQLFLFFLKPYLSVFTMSIVVI